MLLIKFTFLQSGLLLKVVLKVVLKYPQSELVLLVSLVYSPPGSRLQKDLFQADRLYHQTYHFGSQNRPLLAGCLFLGTQLLIQEVLSVLCLMFLQQ